MRKLWEISFPERSEIESPCVDDVIPKYRQKRTTKKRGAKSPCFDENVPTNRPNGSTKKR